MTEVLGKEAVVSRRQAVFDILCFVVVYTCKAQRLCRESFFHLPVRSPISSRSLIALTADVYKRAISLPNPLPCAPVLLGQSF
jgi:hypothetical protein